jgi:hypothetical protein
MTTPTIKAVLARFSGDHTAAIQYCNRIVDNAVNPHVRQEYSEIGQTIWAHMKGTEKHGH